MAKRTKATRFFIFRLIIKALSGLNVNSLQLAIVPDRVFFLFRRVNTLSEYQRGKSEQNKSS